MVFTFQSSMVSGIIVSYVIEDDRTRQTQKNNVNATQQRVRDTHQILGTLNHTTRNRKLKRFKSKENTNVPRAPRQSFFDTSHKKWSEWKTNRSAVIAGRFRRQQLIFQFFPNSRSLGFRDPPPLCPAAGGGL